MGLFAPMKLLSHILELLSYLEHAWALKNDLEAETSLRLRMMRKKCPSCERRAFGVFIQYLGSI